MKLSQEQTAVVRCRVKRIAVNATAGSGKTWTVVQRAQYIGANDVLFLAFNRAAAQEINTRMGWSQYGPPRPGKASTIDSAAWAVANAVGEVQISDRRGDSEQRKRHEDTGKKVLERIGHYVGRDLGGDEWSNMRKAVLWEANQAISKLTAEDKWLGWLPEKAHPDEDKPDPLILAAKDTVDFVVQQAWSDFDLIGTGIHFALRALERGDALPPGWGGIREIIVDEAQDLTPAQWRFVDLLVARLDCRLCLVGDDLQAVNGWRGADVDTYIARCQAPGVALLRLSTNYRCGRSIVDLGARIGRMATRRVTKTMHAAREELGDISLVRPMLLADEPAFAVRWVAQADGVPFKDQMILGRTNASLIGIAWALIHEGVPVDANNIDLADRKVTKALIAFLRSLEGDVESLREAAVYLPGVGRKAVRFVDSWAALPVACRTGRGCLAAQQAAMLIAAAPDDLVGRIRLGVQLLIPEEPPEDREIAKALIDIAGKCEDLDDLERFLAAISNRGGDRVRISTVHRTKGLEAKRVLIVSGFKFPHPRAQSVGELDEEYRLAFVATTRAKDELMISCPQYDARGEELGVGLWGVVREVVARPVQGIIA